MKAPIYLLAGMLLFTSCNKNKTKEEVNGVEISTQDKELLDSLENKLSQATEPLERIKLQKQIIDLKFDKASEEDKEKLFNAFYNSVYTELESLNNRMSSYLENYLDYREIQNEDGEWVTDNDSIINLEKPYIDAGLKFQIHEDGIALLEPTPVLFDKYVKQLPTYYQEYWKLLRDSEELLPNISVNASWRKIGDLLARYEDYANKYPDKAESFKALGEKYQYVQTVYLTGTDYTPIVYENELGENVKEEWQRFSKTYPNSPTTQLIKIVLKDLGNIEGFRIDIRKEWKKMNYPLLKNVETY